jgi:1-acyl-sn-glycerol-3-phosphate acyltransferase
VEEKKLSDLCCMELDDAHFLLLWRQKDKEQSASKGTLCDHFESFLLFDIFFMHSILPDHPFLFLGKSEILKYPIIKTYFKGLNIPVHRTDRQKSARSFIMAKKAVEEGWSIVVFPEGTIPDENNPKMIPFKEGAFRLARALHVPIVPLTFTNNYKLFSDPTDMKGTAYPGVSRVYIHPYVSVEEIDGLTDKELTEKCFNIINEPLILEHPGLIE